MAISEDASTPAFVVSPVNTSGTTVAVTTATFSPPANALLIAAVQTDYNSSGLATFATSSSITGNPAWTAYTGTAVSGGPATQFFALQLSSAPGAITVTATNTNGNAQTMSMAVRVLDGAASVQTGAGAGHGTTTSTSYTTNNPVTSPFSTTQAGSWAYVNVSTDTSEPTATVNNGTIQLAREDDSNVGTEQIVGRQTNPTVTPGTVTLGWTGPSVLYAWAALEILPKVSITTTALPTAPVGYAYSFTLGAEYGATPYTWSISSGSLPGWASLNSSTGVISGTPTSGDIGPTTFTVEVTDNNSDTSTRQFTLTVQAEYPLQSAWPGYPGPSLFVPGELITKSSAVQHTETLTALLVASATTKRAISKRIIASTVTAGIVIRALSHVLAVTLSVLGVLTRQVRRVITGTITATTTVSATKLKIVTLAATVAVTSTVTRQLGKLITAEAVTTGAVTRGISKAITGVAAVTGSVIRKVSRTVSGTVTAAASVANRLVRAIVLVVTIALTAVTPRKIGRILAGQVAVTGVLGRSITRVITAATVVSGKVVRGVSRVLAAQLLLTVALARSARVTLTGFVTGTSSVARRITRKLVAQVTAAGAVGKGRFLTLAANVVAFASTVATKVAGAAAHGPLQIVLPGSGVTSGAFQIVIPALRGALTAAFAPFKHPTLPGPLVNLTGSVWYGVINVVLPLLGVTITGSDYHSVIAVELPAIEVSLTGTVVGNVEGSIFVDLSNRSMGTRFFEELLSPARWKLGAPKRQWKTHVMYTDEVLGQLGIEWGTEPPEVEDI